MNDLAEVVRTAKALIAEMPPGPERDAEERRFNRFADRLQAMPHRVAVRAEMQPADQVHQILVEETAYVVAALVNLG